MDTYIVSEGATLSCSKGTSNSELKVPISHGMNRNGKNRNGKNQATITDSVANVNIMSFGTCVRSNYSVPCTPMIALKWINGKKDFKCHGELALVNTCILPCMKGGIIKICESGQNE